MEINDLFIYGTPMLLTIIGYFLKRSIDGLSAVEKKLNELEIDVTVMKTDYINKQERISEKFNELTDTIKTLTVEIQTLNKEIIKLKKGNEQIN